MGQTHTHRKAQGERGRQGTARWREFKRKQVIKRGMMTTPGH